MTFFRANSIGKDLDMASVATPAESRWIKWGGNFVLGGAILAIVVALVGLTLARYDMVDKIQGFFAFVMMLNPARTLAAIGVLVLIGAYARKTGPKRNAAIGTVLAGALLAVIYTQVIIPGGKVPPIRTGPFSVEEWRAFHEGAYAHIQPVIVNKSPVEVLANARALMQERGWEVATSDPESGQIEGTAFAGYLKFKDDVVVKATPIEDGSTRVDMRSVSQVGVSDLGYNAARVAAFLADLQAR
jgi:hypothetical protein